MNKHTEVKHMPLVKVKRYCQITLPAVIRKKLNIGEGDYLEIEESEGNLVLKPVKVQPDQAYFFSKEWQQGEAEADRDIAAGDVTGPFDDINDAIGALKTTKI